MVDTDFAGLVHYTAQSICTIALLERKTESRLDESPHREKMPLQIALSAGSSNLAGETTFYAAQWVHRRGMTTTLQ